MIKRESLLGKYRLIRPLGSGGFADVYLGQHIYLKTEAAIKLLHTTPELSHTEMQSFLREARTIARLHHRHIVNILDFDIENGTPYLVMEYAPNGSLYSRYQAKAAQTVAPEVLLSYIKQAASALQFAHDHRVIHCDVKPENMLLNSRDEILLSDFGIAVVFHSQMSTQQTLGTMYYMAPEQFIGKPMPASDQYALAVTAYRWLSGQFPFMGQSVEDLCYQHSAVAPRSLRELNPHISSAVDHVVLTALAKSPQQRFPTIAAFARALEEAIITKSFPSSVACSPSSESVPSQASDNEPQVLLPSLFSLLPRAVSVRKQEDDVPFGPTQIYQSMALRRPLAGEPQSPPRLTSLMGGPRQVDPLEENAVLHAHVQQDVTGARRPLSPSMEPEHSLSVSSCIYNQHTGWVTTLAWSPDGIYIASGSWDTTVRVWDAANGDTLVTYRRHTQPVKSVAWSPAGGYIASGSWDTSVQVWAMAGEMLLPNLYRHPSQIEAIAWSPNGRYIASADIDGRIQIWGAFNKRVLCVYSGHQERVSALCWSPNGKYVASTSDDKTVQIWEAQTGQKLFIYYKHHCPVTAVAWSCNGQRIASADEEGTLHIFSAANGDTLRQQQGDDGAIKALCWSPNANYLAVAARLVRIWSSPAACPITSYCVYKGHTDWVNALAWSPDGQKIASASDDTTVQVWKLPAA